MIEYLYDAIRASQNEDITIVAKITDDEGNVITDVCSLSIHDDEKHLMKIEGTLVDGLWEFTIPAMSFKGRYWYCICKNEGDTLCFKQPIYFV